MKKPARLPYFIFDETTRFEWEKKSWLSSFLCVLWFRLLKGLIFFFLLLFYFFSLISISLTSESNFPGNSKVLILEFIPFFLPFFSFLILIFFIWYYVNTILCWLSLWLLVVMMIFADEGFCVYGPVNLGLGLGLCIFWLLDFGI